MGDTDSPDFNKARGYLIGFSMTVLLLWYFGADLSSFKLLGNEIKLKENIENVWLVLACINIYLWLRLLQRMPRNSFRFDRAMHELYDDSLIKLSRRLYRYQLRQFVLKDFRDGLAGVEIAIKKLIVSGEMTHVNSWQDKDLDTDYLSTIRKPPKLKRNEIRFVMCSICMVGGTEVTSQSTTYVMTPHRFFGLAVTSYTFVKGALISPWFADNFIPLILGGWAIWVGINKWWEMNPEVKVAFKNLLDQLIMLL